MASDRTVGDPGITRGGRDPGAVFRVQGESAGERIDAGHLADVAEFASAKKMYEEKKYASAVLGFDKVIQAQPNHWEAYYYRALSKYEIGDYEGSVEDFSTCQPNSTYNVDWQIAN